MKLNNILMIIAVVVVGVALFSLGITINKVRGELKMGMYTDIKFKNPNIILNRKKFDQHLTNLAINAGAKLHLNHKFLHNTRNKTITNKATVKHDFIIGADGPLSPVAKANNLFKNRKFWVGFQARVKLKNNNIIEFFPNIGTLAWIVPENKDIVRIGLLAKNNIKHLFNNLIKNRIKNKDIIEFQGGLVPIYNPKQRLQKNNIYLVGDAATQVKATTGGGIIQSLTAAKILANTIKTDYEKQCKKHIAKDLKIHLLMRQTMNKFKNKDWDLVNLFKKQSNKQILENFDRDYPSKFLLKLIMKEPRLLYFSRFLL